mmetsp:Transcript_24896/g.31346  ORF Transcript_24896/g.31346 Transcript_24896/m.31346 type:complete len:182 (-) Transcript_24896:193-738(-)
MHHIPLVPCSDNNNSSGSRSHLRSSNNSTGIGDNMIGSATATSGGSTKTRYPSTSSSSASTSTSTLTSTLTSTSNGVNVKDLINVNAGGPYGSEVLVGIQKDSDAVWETIVKGGKEGNNNHNGNDDNNGNDNDDDDKGVGHDWYKASIKIEAHADKDWTARAVLPDGTDGEVYIFEAPRKV